MQESLIYLYTHFNEETILFSLILFGISCVALTILWIFNKKKFHDLAHQVPASVVKTYLDTIIQNSNALKSGLFRGGGLDLGPGLLGNISTGGGGDNSALLNQKMAELSALSSQLSEKNGMIRDLEKRLRELENMSDSAAEVSSLQRKNSDLERQLKDALANAGSSSGGASKAQLDSVTKERDELKDRLAEYEIIEDDLANLKRLQAENEELRAKLGNNSSNSAPAPAPAAKKEAASAPPKVEEVVEEADLSAQSISGDEKSAEDLLGEFEKMLG